MTQFLGVAGEIEETNCLDLTVTLLKARGGTALKVPQKAKGTVLADLIGLDAAALLIEKFCIRNLDLLCWGMASPFAKWRWLVTFRCARRQNTAAS